VAKWNLGWLLGLVSFTALGFSLTASIPQGNKHDNLKLLVDISELVDEKYVKELTKEQKRQCFEAAANGYLEKLDPYSAFINEEEYKQFNKQSEGKFGGIGIRIAMESGVIYVESPMIGTPAYDAGILTGDIILKIDNEPTKNMALRTVVDKITGKPETDVTLTVLHEGFKDPEKDAVDIKVTRAEIKLESVHGDVRMKNKLEEWNYWVDADAKIAYIRISSFSRTTVAELTKVVDMLQRQGMTGLVVDLRDNPGGLLQAAVEVSSIFLPEGDTVVTTKGRGEGNEFVYKAKHGNFKPKNNYPLAILINHNSASASEIVAAALQDHLRAVIVGERSFGKGSVQNVIPMENGKTALKLTTASYWRPSNRNIHRFPDAKKEDEWGVKPNDGFEIEIKTDERVEYLKYRRERDIIKRPGAEKKDGTVKDEKKEKFKDRVLEKAKDYIRDELKKKAGDPNAQFQAPPPPAPARPADLIDPTRSVGALTPSRNWLLREERLAA
jgi:carboxyl-terminal processing protease